jgi:beta-mannosidase
MRRTSIELAGPWSFRQVGGEGEALWMPATVPGCVHTDLFANGKIEDPFQGTHERDQQWIDRSGWEYRTTFVADDALLQRDQIDLVCAGSTRTPKSR